MHLAIFKELRSNNIGVQVHYIPIHLQPYYRNLGFKRGDFPNAEIYALNAISLPMYPNLNEEVPKKIIKIIENVIKNFNINFK